jgi:hypothetical protein
MAVSKLKTIKKKTVNKSKVSSSKKIVRKPKFSPNVIDKSISFSLSKSEPKIRISKKAVKKAIPLAIGAGATVLAGGLLYKFNKGFKNQYVYGKASDKQDSFGNIIDRRQNSRLNYLKELLKDIKQKYYTKDKNYIPLAPGNNTFKKNYLQFLLKRNKKDGKEEIVRNEKGEAIYVTNPNIIKRKIPEGQEDLTEPGEVNENDILKPLKTKYLSFKEFSKEQKQKESKRYKHEFKQKNKDLEKKQEEIRRKYELLVKNKKN